MPSTHSTIVNLIVHKLLKNAHENADIELRPGGIVNVTPTAQRVIDELHKLYSERTGKGYGTFDNDENNFPMSRYVRQHFIDNSIDFSALTKLMMEHLKVRSSEEQLATGGHVLIAHVNNGATDFLLTAIVTDTIGAAITAGAMDFIDSIYLDISHFRFAGRINLTSWQAADEERYISFLKGSGDVSGYFKKFLGCNDVLSARRETQKLIEGLGLFATNQHLELEKRDSFFEHVHSYLNDLAKNNMPLSLDALANNLWSNAPNDLLAVLTDENLELSDGFVPDKKEIKKLVKFKGIAAHWKLEFDREALRFEDVRYNKNNNTLILSNVPDALRLELLAELGDG